MKTTPKTPDWHRHRWDITGKQISGKSRVCLDCGERQTKTGGKWTINR